MHMYSKCTGNYARIRGGQAQFFLVKELHSVTCLWNYCSQKLVSTQQILSSANSFLDSCRHQSHEVPYDSFQNYFNRLSMVHNLCGMCDPKVITENLSSILPMSPLSPSYLSCILSMNSQGQWHSPLWKIIAPWPHRFQTTDHVIHTSHYATCFSLLLVRLQERGMQCILQHLLQVIQTYTLGLSQWCVLIVYLTSAISVTMLFGSLPRNVNEHVLLIKVFISSASNGYVTDHRLILACLRRGMV